MAGYLVTRALEAGLNHLNLEDFQQLKEGIRNQPGSILLRLINLKSSLDFDFDVTNTQTIDPVVRKWLINPSLQNATSLIKKIRDTYDAPQPSTNNAIARYILCWNVAQPKMIFHPVVEIMRRPPTDRGEHPLFENINEILTQHKANPVKEPVVQYADEIGTKERKEINRNINKPTIRLINILWKFWQDKVLDVVKRDGQAYEKMKKGISLSDIEKNQLQREGFTIFKGVQISRKRQQSKIDNVKYHGGKALKMLQMVVDYYLLFEDNFDLNFLVDMFCVTGAVNKKNYGTFSVEVCHLGHNQVADMNPINAVHGSNDDNQAQKDCSLHPFFGCRCLTGKCLLKTALIEDPEMFDEFVAKEKNNPMSSFAEYTTFPLKNAEQNLRRRLAVGAINTCSKYYFRAPPHLICIALGYETKTEWETTVANWS